VAELYRAGEPPGWRTTGATGLSLQFTGLDLFVGPASGSFFYQEKNEHKQ